MITLTLKWPPSINHYWEARGKQRFIGAKGRAYIAHVRDVVLQLGQIVVFVDTPLKVTVNAFPPDRRKRDLDNVLKALLDSLEKSGLIDNDYNIHHLSVERGPMQPPGRISVTIERYHPLRLIT